MVLFLDIYQKHKRFIVSYSLTEDSGKNPL